MKHAIRGIDHIGMTVPDIEQATTFFRQAFGAEVIYESVSRAEKDKLDQDAQQSTLQLFPGTQVHAVRMLQLQHGPGVELFEMHGPEQHEPQRPSDFGLQHFALYVDDFAPAIDAFTRAGGRMFTEPKPLSFPTEKGPGNAFCYGATPWGSVIEFISTPSYMPYEETTPLRRWKP